MADETYFVGTTLDSAEIAPGSPAGFSDNGAVIGINGVNAAIADLHMIDPASGQRGGITGPWWFHAVLVSPGNAYASGLVLISFFTEAGVEWGRLTGDSTGAQGLIFQYWDGSAFVSVGSTLTFSGGGSGTIDLYVDRASGEFGFYWNGTKLFGATGLSITGFSDLGKIRLGRFRAFNSNGSYSSLIVANYNTISHVVRRRTPTGNGNYTAWTGAYTDVDDTALNDTDVINANTTGDKESFTAAALSATGTGLVIKAVAVALRHRNDGGASPQNIKPFLRFGGVDYPALDDVITTTSMRSGLAIWDNDPSTGLAWAAITNANGEFGVEATA